MSSGKNRLLFVFLDGVGLGEPGDSNPFSAAATPGLNRLLGTDLGSSTPEITSDRFLFRSLDARLGTRGLPQSATGQSTLLTGRNAAEVMNGHYGPWPGPTLKKFLAEGNLFSQAVTAGASSTIANMYPPGYFRALKEERSRVNAPVHAALTAGLRLRELADFEAGKAVSADLSGRFLQKMEPGSRTVTPAVSGRELLSLAADLDFTFFDFWLSDQVGHRGSMAEAHALVSDLDEFLAAVLEPAGDGGPDDLTVLVTSDHGNLEDKSLRTHTLNPVPLMVAGKRAAEFAGVTDLTGVAPAIRRILSV